jgi:hypothetical protein
MNMPSDYVKRVLFNARLRQLAQNTAKIRRLDVAYRFPEGYPHEQCSARMSLFSFSANRKE